MGGSVSLVVGFKPSKAEARSRGPVILLSVNQDVELSAPPLVPCLYGEMHPAMLVMDQRAETLSKFQLNNYFKRVTMFLISLNINGLNSPIKKHRITDWIHRQDPTFCWIQETYLKVKGWERFPRK